MSPRGRKKIWHLYRWNLNSLGWLSVKHHPSQLRGKLIGVYFSYKRMVEVARKKARLGGYDEADWVHLYDYEGVTVDAIIPTSGAHTSLRRGPREPGQARAPRRRRQTD